MILVTVFLFITGDRAFDNQMKLPIAFLLLLISSCRLQDLTQTPNQDAKVVDSSSDSSGDKSAEKPGDASPDSDQDSSKDDNFPKFEAVSGEKRKIFSSALKWIIGFLNKSHFQKLAELAGVEWKNVDHYSTRFISKFKKLKNYTSPNCSVCDCGKNFSCLVKQMFCLINKLKSIMRALRGTKYIDRVRELKRIAWDYTVHCGSRQQSTIRPILWQVIQNL